jgi:hypothetical protein
MWWCDGKGDEVGKLMGSLLFTSARETRDASDEQVEVDSTRTLENGGVSYMPKVPKIWLFCNKIWGRFWSHLSQFERLLHT